MSIHQNTTYSLDIKTKQIVIRIGNNFEQKYEKVSLKVNKKKKMFYVDLTNEDGSSSKGEEEKKVEKNGNKFNSGKNKPCPDLTMSKKCFLNCGGQVLEQKVSIPHPPPPKKP